MSLKALAAIVSAGLAALAAGLPQTSVDVAIQSGVLLGVGVLQAMIGAYLGTSVVSFLKAKRG